MQHDQLPGRRFITTKHFSNLISFISKLNSLESLKKRKNYIIMKENIKFIVTEVNKLLGRNYNVIYFNSLSPEELLQVRIDIIIFSFH